MYISRMRLTREGQLQVVSVAPRGVIECCYAEFSHTPRGQRARHGLHQKCRPKAWGNRSRRAHVGVGFPRFSPRVLFFLLPLFFFIVTVPLRVSVLVAAFFFANNLSNRSLYSYYLYRLRLSFRTAGFMLYGLAVFFFAWFRKSSGH